MVLHLFDSFATLVIPLLSVVILLSLMLTYLSTQQLSRGRRSPPRVKRSLMRNALATNMKSLNKVALDRSSFMMFNTKTLVNITVVVSVVRSKPIWLLMVSLQSISIPKSKIKSISNTLPNMLNSGVQSNSIQLMIMHNHTSNGSSTVKNSIQKMKESKLFLSVSLDQCVSIAQDIKTQEKLLHTIQVVTVRPNWKSSHHLHHHHHPCHQWKTWFSISFNQLLQNNWSMVPVSSVSFPISPTTPPSNGSKMPNHSRPLPNTLSKLVPRQV